MSTKTYPLKLPASLKEAAARLAKADGVSLNQWIATAVAQKVGVVETARDFLLRRAGAATGEGMSALLELVPAAEPAAEDRIPGAVLQGSKTPKRAPALRRRHTPRG